RHNQGSRLAPLKCEQRLADSENCPSRIPVRDDFGDMLSLLCALPFGNHRRDLPFQFRPGELRILAFQNGHPLPRSGRYFRPDRLDGWGRTSYEYRIELFALRPFMDSLRRFSKNSRVLHVDTLPKRVAL